MSPIHQHLVEVGGQLNRWQAARRAVITTAAVLGVLWLAGVADIAWQFSKPGRFTAWAVLLALAGAGVGFIVVALNRRRNPESVAARLEQTFPQLDNRLINFIQFSHAGATDDPLRQAYVRQGVPDYAGLELRQLKDRAAHRRASIALAAAIVVLLVPAFWMARTWTNALARILNPFSARPPATLATIRDVLPGAASVVSGSPLALACRAEGKAGQEVWVDLWPADDKPASIKLAALTGRGLEDFSYPLAKVTSAFQYRYRVGDARSERFPVDVVPPLAFTSLRFEVAPPAYTKLPVRAFDALTENVVIQQGATVVVTLACNRPLTSAVIGRQKATANGETWTATVSPGAARVLPVTAVAATGEKLETPLKFQLVPDAPPLIRVIAPKNRTTLPVGAAPRIEWTVTDDYGLTGVAVEDENGEVIEQWTVDDQPSFERDWVGGPLPDGKSGSFRIAARDHAQRSQSPLIIFDATGSADIVAAHAALATNTAVTLARVVALQRDNLQTTMQLDRALASSTPAQWTAVAQTQRTIRQLTGQLLADARKPLGALSPVVQKVHAGAMREVIDALERLPQVEPPQRPALSAQAVLLETRILQALTSVAAGLERVEKHREITGVLALLDALIAGQEEALAGAKTAISKSLLPPPALIQKQDALAGDVSEFVQVCRGEAQRLEGSDKDFAQLLAQVADGCEQRAVAAEMLRAAEQLEQKAPAQARPHQERALAALKEFQKLLNEWRVREAQKDMADLKQVVAEAAKKFDKLVALQAKIVESMRAADQRKDLSAQEQHEFLDEMHELKANIKDAALKIADDLHIFPELPVGNELVQDIYQVFEEVKQVPGSENAPAEELGLQKEDFMLDLMEQIKERFDDMEMWLTAKPDNVKRLTENFDQQEMPKMAVIDLPKELEDIIGELMEQQEEIRDKSDDSATNQAVPDLPMGWDIVEGEWSTFSGKGKSGNERPEHKDQDGRSLVGREGMADGETVAGSGKINEGDEKIEERRTQDSPQAGYVQEEDHAEAKATGGGKSSGYAEKEGMPGVGPRRDAPLPGSILGLQAMLRRDAEALYARASLLHVRTGALDEAVRAMRDAEQAVADGRPIQQVQEFQRRAVAALKKTQTDLDASYGATALDVTATTPPQPQTAGAPDEAPANYRNLVAEYFKSLSETP